MKGYHFSLVWTLVMLTIVQATAGPATVAVAVPAGDAQAGLGHQADPPVNRNATDPIYDFDEKFLAYYPVEEVNSEMRKFEAENPDIAKVIDLSDKVGTTTYGRRILAIKISDNVDRYEDEAKLVVVGNVHAREWLGYECAMYYIWYLLSQYGQPPTDNDLDGALNEDPFDGVDNDGDGLVDEDGNEARATFIVDSYETYIIPMPNPDGLAYDLSNYEPGQNGGWRKNMRDNNNNGEFDSNYDGVDLNRNYPYKWAANRYYVERVNERDLTADSAFPGSDQYRGPEDNFDDDGDSRVRSPDWLPNHYGIDWNNVDEDPVDGLDNDGDGLIDEDPDGGFSEVETRSVEELMKMLDPDGDHYNGQSDVTMSMTYHSYASLILHPWGYTSENAPDEELMSDIALPYEEMTGYQSIKGTDLYSTGGDSDDWFYGSHGSLAYTIELPGYDGGFHPSTEYIINCTRPNTAVLMLMNEQLETARAAKGQGAKSMDIGVPVINHSRWKGEISTIWEYKVEAEIENEDNIEPGTLMVYYRVNNEPEWNAIEMKGSDGRYRADIPMQHDGDVVSYYIHCRDYRDVNIYYPKYGFAEPITYTVLQRVAASVGDMASVFLVMLLFYGTIWGGFYNAVKKAMRAEEAKKDLD